MYIFWGHCPLKFGKAKTSKIWHDFEQLSTLTANQEPVEISKLEKNLTESDPGGFSKKLVKFGLLTKKLWEQMYTHPKTTMSVLRMLMHPSSGHVTSIPKEFHSPEFFSQSDLRHRVDSRWALPQISSSDFFG